MHKLLGIVILLFALNCKSTENKTKMTKEATKKCISELKKLKSMSSMSAEATVVRNYLDWMIELPWYIKDKKSDSINIEGAKKAGLQTWHLNPKTEDVTSLLEFIKNI